MEKGVALVTGAGGFIGPVLIRALLRSGYRVRALCRTPPIGIPIPSEAEVLIGDIRDPAAVSEAVKDIRVVFHLASLLHQRNATELAQGLYDSVNVGGTVGIQKAAMAAGVERLIYVSTINVYGNSQGRVVFDEDTRPEPSTPYGTSKLAAERVVLNAGTGPSPVILRLAAVYGPRMRGNYTSLVSAMRKGLFIPVGDGCNRRTLVHVEDVAQASLLAAERPNAVGKVYNVTDGEVHSLRSILNAISDCLGRRRPRVYLSENVVHSGLAMASAIPGLSEVSLRAASLVNKLTEDIAISGDRMKEELGYRPAVDLRMGWQSAITGTV